MSDLMYKNANTTNNNAREETSTILVKSIAKNGIIYVAKYAEFTEFMFSTLFIFTNSSARDLHLFILIKSIALESRIILIKRYNKQKCI